ncbi:MAG: hypothetical protein LBQ74_13745 [Prevotella sp.]|jgi:predicted site-specific integrase-resolvase|nr:hypothetical protein [Prevotella sp.]
MDKITYSEIEAANAIGISRMELIRERNAGRITFLVKADGKKILYRAKDIEEYLRKYYKEYKASLINH